MPSTYAHYRFGVGLLPTMPGDVRRTIQRDLEDPISETIIDSFEHPFSSIRVTVENDDVQLDVQ